MPQVTITKDTPGLIEDDAFWFNVEASDLGLAPGEVPAELPTTLGNGLSFLLVKADACGFLYKQDLGCTKLMVFND